MKLALCPCCRGKPFIRSLAMGKKSKRIKMWQISCGDCGLSSDVDEDKKYTTMRWNMRKEYDNLKTWLTFMVLLLPVSVMVSLLLGNLIGVSLVNSP